MKCESFRQRLLGVPDPRQLPDDLLAHARACDGCRRRWERLALLERSVATIPAPTGELAKAALLHRLESGAPAAPRPEPWSARLAFLSRNGVVIGTAAAAVLVLAVGLGWWLSASAVPGFVKRPADPLLAKVLERDLELAVATTPRKRAETLADLADDLHTQTRTLARVAGGDDLAQLVKQYRKVVFQGVVGQAGQVARAERGQVAREMDERLAKAGREAEGLAAEVPPASAAALRDMAEAARQAREQLRELTREGGGS